MTGAVLDRPGSLFAEPAGADASADPAGVNLPADGARQASAPGRLTLEALLNGALAETRAHGDAECPLCHARMRPARAGARESADCGGCGSRLA